VIGIKDNIQVSEKQDKVWAKESKRKYMYSWESKSPPVRSELVYENSCKEK
jgi:hypothetical protein